MNIRKEQMNEHFTKFHIEGLGFQATIHRFSTVDPYPFPHDHPYNFTTYILKGSYIEEVYNIYPDKTGFDKTTIVHKAQTCSYISANHIHKIISLPEGECVTIIVPEKGINVPGFYNFTPNGIFYRKWHEEEFKSIL